MMMIVILSLAALTVAACDAGTLPDGFNDTDNDSTIVPGIQDDENDTDIDVDVDEDENQTVPPQTNGNNVTSNDGRTRGTANVMFAVTADAGNNVDSVEASFESVQMRTQDGEWFSFPLDDRTSYDLSELGDDSESALLANVTVPAATYDRVRFEINNITVTDNRDASEVVVSTRTIEFGAAELGESFDVNQDGTHMILVNLDMERSLYMTDDDRFVFLPVMQVEFHEDPNVEDLGDDRIEVDDESVTTNATLVTTTQGRFDEEGASDEIESGAQVTIIADEIVIETDDGTTSRLRINSTTTDGSTGTTTSDTTTNTRTTANTANTNDANEDDDNESIFTSDAYSGGVAWS